MKFKRLFSKKPKKGKGGGEGDSPRTAPDDSSSSHATPQEIGWRSPGGDGEDKPSIDFDDVSALGGSIMEQEKHRHPEGVIPWNEMDLAAYGEHQR